MVKEGKILIKEFEGGTKLYNYDPPSDVEDAEDLNCGCRVVSMARGITKETAKKNANERGEKSSLNSHYTEVVPCVACCHCVIVRENRNGELENTTFACQMLKRMVTRYGTCDHGNAGRLGPTVIERDMTIYEMQRAKENMVN